MTFKPDYITKRTRSALLLGLVLLFLGPKPCPGGEGPSADAQTTQTFSHQGPFSADNESRESVQRMPETELTGAVPAGDSSPDNGTTAEAAGAGKPCDDIEDIIHSAFENLAAADQAPIPSRRAPAQTSSAPPAPPAEARPAAAEPDAEPDKITSAFDELETLAAKTASYDNPGGPAAAAPPEDAVLPAPEKTRGAEPDREPPGETLPPAGTVPVGVKPEPRKSYFENGNLRSVFMVAAGVLNGPARVYDEDGRLLVEAQYKDNALEGVAKRYFADGVSWREEHYKDGKLNGLCTTYIGGRIRFIDSYQNGQKINRKAYDARGKLEFDQSYPHDG